MRVVQDREGRPWCYHCERPFDKDPFKSRDEQLWAHLRAMPDDIGAARAFYFENQNRIAKEEARTVWMNRFGFSGSPGVAVLVEGIKVAIDPSVPHEAVVDMVDQFLLRLIRKQLVEALDGTQEPEPPEDLGRFHVVPKPEPDWYPEAPGVWEMYPDGFWRTPDGSVIAGRKPPETENEPEPGK